MGLDMYAYAVDRAAITKPADFKVDDLDATNLHTWRKHPNLHGWMEALYRAKGGQDPEFDLVPVTLDAADLDRLEQDVRAGNLPPTSGFFFGESDGSEQDDDLLFIAKARAALAEGLAVYYRAWW